MQSCKYWRCHEQDLRTTGKNVESEDLLGRDPVHLDQTMIGFLRGREDSCNVCRWFNRFSCRQVQIQTKKGVILGHGENNGELYG